MVLVKLGSATRGYYFERTWHPRSPSLAHSSIVWERESSSGSWHPQQTSFQMRLSANKLDESREGLEWKSVMLKAWLQRLSPVYDRRRAIMKLNWKLWMIKSLFASWLGSLKVIPTLKILNLHHPNFDTTFFSGNLVRGNGIGGVLIRGKLLC